MVSTEVYERSQHKLEILQFLARGEREIEEGEGFDLETVLAEADALRRRAEEALLRLQRFPLYGKVLPEFPDLPFREFVIPPYRFFYRIKGKTIWIVAVWHGSQLPDSPPEIQDR